MQNVGYNQQGSSGYSDMLPNNYGQASSSNGGISDHGSSNVNYSNAANNSTFSQLSPIFDDLVRMEMERMLNQMYSEMGVTDPMTIVELADANPALYQQMKLTSEETVKETLLATSSQPTSNLNMLSHSMQGNVSNMGSDSAVLDGYNNMNYSNYDSVNGNGKRPLSTLSAVLEVAKRPQYSNSFPTGPSGQTYPQGFSIDFPSNDNNYIDTKSIINQSTSFNGVGASSEGMEPTHPLASSVFINSFINEVPVVVDVTRVKKLSESLTNNVINSNGESADSLVRDVYQFAAVRSLQRLDPLVAEVMIQPHLPNILLGSLFDFSSNSLSNHRILFHSNK